MPYFCHKGCLSSFPIMSSTRSPYERNPQTSLGVLLTVRWSETYWRQDVQNCCPPQSGWGGGCGKDCRSLPGPLSAEPLRSAVVGRLTVNCFFSHSASSPHSTEDSGFLKMKPAERLWSLPWSEIFLWKIIHSFKH